MALKNRRIKYDRNIKNGIERQKNKKINLKIRYFKK